MTLEYLVLGILLILMGGVQTWFRHSSGTAAGNLGGSEALGPEEAHVGDRPDGWNAGGRLRSGRRWEAWTAIVGILGMILGVVMVVLGVLGK